MNFNQFKNSNSVLRKDQMKDIKGGGTCGFKSSTGTVGCNVSKAGALHMVADGGYWCCESCGISSYCG